MIKLGLNVGSGQRKFKSTDELEWINCDSSGRENPDVIDDARGLAVFTDCQFDFVVLHHVLEHFVLTDAGMVVRACHRVLKPSGTLFIFLPNLRALAQRWLMGQIDDYIMFVNVYGAYQGENGDLHKWAYTPVTLEKLLRENGQWAEIDQNWWTLPGAQFASDWWTQEFRAVKR